MLSGWVQGATTATTEAKDSSTPAQGGLLNSIMSMGGLKEKFQNFLLSHMPQLSDEMSVQFLEVLKILLGSAPIPGASLFITPVIDGMIRKYHKEPSKTIALNPDTTDALIFKLMTHKMEDGNLQEFLQIGGDSGLMRQIEGHFMKSLQQVIDHSSANFMEEVKKKAAMKSTVEVGSAKN
ncbi:uncharacterized protein LOC135849189 isoform X2 [Planococcus citri]